ncbi:hypothetical protein QVD17_31484 [Tagetes erecta]|uniref:TPX2 C-terminal domain-containing protein n=1 Tax=Tagetes erecta TaxID=13708 RepID=A0AAD8NNJ6_TARER|nr:hypothetical protein QVD17_31484 [Tagetes erecta]
MFMVDDSLKNMYTIEKYTRHDYKYYNVIEPTPIIETQMGESRQTLGVSVSFGKYDNDALSWEKWSTFSPNKYLDEVGKCSTPGSVAQKKAFFEAHYKKIAALKAEAELQDQLNATHSDPSTSVNQTQLAFEQVEGQHKDCNDDVIHGSAELQTVVDERNLEEKLNLDEKIDFGLRNVGEKINLDEKIDLGQTSVDEKINLDEGKFDGRNVDESVKVDNVLKSQEHLMTSEYPIVMNSCVDKLEEAVLVNDESMKLVKQHFNVDLETQTCQETEESNQRVRKPEAENAAKKVNVNQVEKNSLTMKKKEASLIPKAAETSVTRLTKPKASPTTTATSNAKSSVKKRNATPSSSSMSSKNKSYSVSESRRVTPMSMHLSMSMNSMNSDTASSVTSSRRRSLFMEQMGDKDIVKRAFKTFQNRVNQLPSSDIGPKQFLQPPTKASQRKASTSMAHQKENEKLKKAAEKIIPARGQGGPTWKSVSSGSLKGIGADERRLKSGPTSAILKSNEKAERRKEFLKNLEEKSNAREAERSKLGSKPKEVKDVEMKRPKQNLNFKAKPMPSFYRAQGVSKSSSEKEVAKTGTTRRPDPHR